MPRLDRKISIPDAVPADGIASDYARDLIRIVNQARNAIEPRIIAAIDAAVREGVGLRDADFLLTIRRIVETGQDLFIRRASMSRLRDWVRTYSDLANEFSRTSLERQYRRAFPTAPRPIFDREELDAGLAGLKEMQLAKTRGVMQLYFDDLKLHVIDRYEVGSFPATLEGLVLKRGDIAQNRAIFLARNFVTRSVAEADRVYQQQLGVRRYIWRTSSNQSVRDLHERNHNKKFAWDKPPEKTGHPGTQINCRCRALPVIEEMQPRR